MSWEIFCISYSITISQFICQSYYLYSYCSNYRNIISKSSNNKNNSNSKSSNSEMNGSTNNLKKCNNQSLYKSNPNTKTNDFDNNDELIRCIGLPTSYSPPSQLLEKAPDAAVYRSASNSRQTTPENDKDVDNINEHSHPNSANTATHNSLHNTIFRIKTN